MSNKRPRPPVDNPLPTRAEDVLNKGIRAGIGALPVLGSSLVEFLAFVVGDPAQERRDDFMKVTLERVLELESQFDQLDKEALRSNEQFQATFIQATRLSTQAASEEKRTLLQNAILNSAILDIEENQRQILDAISGRDHTSSRCGAERIGQPAGKSQCPTNAGHFDGRAQPRRRSRDS
jgi:hypothetical protein